MIAGPKHLKKEYSIGSRFAKVFAKLLATPQRRVVPKISRAPGLKAKASSGLKESKIEAPRTIPIASQSRQVIFSLKIKKAKIAVVTISKLWSKDAVSPFSIEIP